MLEQPACAHQVQVSTIAERRDCCDCATIRDQHTDALYCCCCTWEGLFWSVATLSINFVSSPTKRSSSICTVDSSSCTSPADMLDIVNVFVPLELAGTLRTAAVWSGQQFGSLSGYACVAQSDTMIPRGRSRNCELWTGASATKLTAAWKRKGRRSLRRMGSTSSSVMMWKRNETNPATWPTGRCVEQEKEGSCVRSCIGSTVEHLKTPPQSSRPPTSRTS